MSVYITEEEQVENLKKWWGQYGNWISGCFLIFLLSFLGYQYWNKHQQKILVQASQAYEHMMISLSNQDTGSVRAFADQLIHDYSKTVYADAAHLTVAKELVNKSAYKQSLPELDTVIQSGKMPALRQIAKIRKARVLLTLKQFDKSLAALEGIDDKIYLPYILETRGDILFTSGKIEQASKMYKQAREEAGKIGIISPFLELKMENLA